MLFNRCRAVRLSLCTIFYAYFAYYDAAMSETSNLCIICVVAISFWPTLIYENRMY